MSDSPGCNALKTKTFISIHYIQEIADVDGRRELVHKKSLHHQLGKLASETVSVSRHTPLIIRLILLTQTIF